MNKRIFLAAPLAALCLTRAANAESAPMRLITLDPGHFHAALVQKQMLPGVSPDVRIYAPDGPDLALHIERIERFNTRPDAPTSWKTTVYRGPDFLERMIAEKAGDVVVIAGNNRAKTRYILESVKAGLHVLADKPMAITPADYDLLREAFAVAAEKGLLIYDIMTERFEITSQIQRFFAHQTAFFGAVDPGAPDDPSVIKESVHHFYKLVAGSPLQRPPWFYDVAQEGEGIVDVTTHLVDLVQWGVFPGRVLGSDDAKVLSARTWTTRVTREQFERSTKTPEFPDYLRGWRTADGDLEIPCNGEFTYTLNGIHARISVTWNYEAPDGGGDTHYSLLRGTKVSAIIRQGREQNFKPVLYLEPREGVDPATIEAPLARAAADAAEQWPGVVVVREDKGWVVNVPQTYHVGHEAHFTQVAQNYIRYLQEGKMPDWEAPNMLTKYHTIMDAYRQSRK